MIARGAVAAAAMVCAIGGSAAPAAGQTRAPRLEISAGALFAGGYDLAGPDANITGNQTGGSDYTLFRSSTRVDAAGALEARAGWRLSRRFVVEGGVFASRPRLSARLTSDVEGIPDTTIAEDLSLYIFDAAILVNFGTRTGRAVPFVRAGVGYLRELHEDNVLVETGLAYHVGGGATFWLGRRGRTGVRVDARVYVLRDGIDLDNGSRTVPAAGAAFVFAF